jgi:hypothetical protein
MGNPCQDETLLSAYMDGELTKQQAHNVRQHIQGCESCRRRLADLKTTDTLIQGLEAIEPSVNFDRSFWSKIDRFEARRTNRWWIRWMYPIWRPAFATGLAAGLAMGLFILNSPDKGVDIEDRFITENIELLNDYDLIYNLDILENWNAIEAMKELS